MDEIVPVFILGKQRSGTTWLANLLCNHSQIAGVVHPAHHGSHDSVYFLKIDQRYGDLSEKTNFTEFAEVMLASDFFRLAGITREQLYAMYPATYAEVFDQVMRRFAASQGAAYWLEKTPAHTPMVERLATLFETAKFVGIIRDIRSVAESEMKRRPAGERASLRRWLALTRLVFKWDYFNRMMTRFADRSDRILIIEYARLLDDTEGVLRRICAFLGLDYEADLTQVRFRPNTSFGDGSERKGTLAPGEVRYLTLLAALSRMVPTFVLSGYDRLTARRRYAGSLPPWFFKLHWSNMRGDDPG